jgi:hypothetical protein
MLARYAARSVRTSLLADLSLSRALETSSFIGLVIVEDVSWRREFEYTELGRDASAGSLFSEVGTASPNSEGGMDSGNSIL